MDYASVQVPIDTLFLDADLTIPSGSQGIVMFAHGSGSGRTSPRNRYVAEVLARAGLSTLLLDLLTPKEEAIDNHTRHLRFDIRLLARRLIGAVDWLSHHPSTSSLHIGLFGASTGAAGALVAAAERPNRVNAVVSRGGRPDLAYQALLKVRAPTLLIVGGRDDAVIHLNREAMSALRTVKTLEIIPGATHLFEEPGALEHVARLARDWFVRYLTTIQRRA